MESIYILAFILMGMAVFALLVVFVFLLLKSPFKYPYYTLTFDVSGKRSPKVGDFIDSHLINYGFNEFSKHWQVVEQWKEDSKELISKCKLKKLRKEQFEKIIDDDHMFCFKLVRKQTRYKQAYYVKSSYSVYATVAKYYYNLKEIQQRFDALAKIDFECTLSEYYSKDQRKKMTKALRDEIAKRDNYTCQICGKYMPDGVGLHINHIIPIKKGGKSIPSNLQVLCSKCNGKKSNK